jgi:hypothetical protein
VKKLPLLLLFCLTLPAARAQQALERNQDILRFANGIFDMAQQPRAFSFFMILDQEGLRFPSFWAGENGGGRITIAPETDLLSGDLLLNTEGSFSLLVTRSSQRAGMENIIPGGPWMRNLREQNFRVVFTEFFDAAAAPPEEGRRPDPNTVRLQAQARGHVEVQGQKAPFEGRATFIFSRSTPSFRFHSTVTFRGDALGLTGAQAGPIQASISTLSPLGEALPPPASGGSHPGDPLDMFGF